MSNEEEIKLKATGKFVKARLTLYHFGKSACVYELSRVLKDA